jgi:hypothetical protein
MDSESMHEHALVAPPIRELAARCGRGGGAVCVCGIGQVCACVQARAARASSRLAHLREAIEKGFGQSRWQSCRAITCVKRLRKDLGNHVGNHVGQSPA